ncbi:zinc-binding dehydrogenase (plasmid) [Cupriavidus sp. P-10]|uniref:zinc-binding dehydrogenase n=1 Tax=Cupriavidus sp. P-10 TaxID=2027911 RepID=UPI000E2E5FBA|nr:zinc-binding dehydrogenase [Cupriavidus sp. P-10]BDB29237.1 zinc-binding dehydrogenase [Cupriavidus sp. P-10]
MAQIIRMYETGAPQVLRLEQADVGMPGPGQVRITQDAIGVNFVDTMVRNGSYPVPLPTVPGFEGAGTVTQVGPGVSGLAAGDRVAYFFASGAYASERLIDAESLIQLPDDICTFTAATFLAKGFTAWMALRALHRLEPGQTAIVTGASGSVGSILSRWAKALGATVIGIAGSRDKLAKVRAGAHHALYAGDIALGDEIRAVAPDGVDVLFDLVGQATSDEAAQAVRAGGGIVAIGAASGLPLTVPADLAQRGIQIKRGGTPQFVNGTSIDAASAELFSLIRSGAFRDIDAVHFELADAVRAHQSIEQRTLGGIPLLVPNSARC